ncbi:hypothetical protein TWF506_004720 [Arthrobotrys conoides]|uniref:Uncharacterized protein n=1 Tax=Arthrobotrys conoides TaxID=74498 RepID=A0AAN8NB55_9PEZI
MANSSFRLFDLPREIRDTIYFHLTNVSKAPLEPDLKTQLLYPAPSINFNYSHWRDDRLVIAHVALSIYYSTTLPRYPLLPVLQTCRQLRSEFQNYISLLQKKPAGNANPLGYTLDVESYHSEIFLKWTRLQLPPEPPYNVIPEFRINYKVMNLRKRHDNSLRFYANGMLWDEGLGLFNLLNDFFHHGPQGFYSPRLNDGDDGGRCSQIVIRRLVLNVTLVHAPVLKALFVEAAKKKAEGGPDGLSEAEFEKFITEMKDFEYSILNNFSGWMAKFLAVGHLDGIVDEVQILWDDFEDWDTMRNLQGKYQVDLTAIFGTKTIYDLPVTQRRKNIIEPDGWDRCVWGRKKNFQVPEHGPLWADRWIESDGVWVPPGQAPQKTGTASGSGVELGSTPDQGPKFVLRLQNEVGEALEHYEGRQGGPAAE